MFRLFAFLVAMLVADSCNAGAFACHGARITIETTDTGPLTIDFSIRNETDSDIVLDGNSLPWISHRSIRFLRVNGDGGATESVDPGDGSSGPQPGVPLRAGATVHGPLNLEDFSTGLRSYLSEAHADLFWLYKVRDERQKIVSRCAGWILLPRSGSSSP